jgi:hypothetical protein
MLWALAVGHEVLVAKAAIPAQQPGALGRRELLPPLPKSLAHRPAVTLFARRHHHVQGQPQPRDKERVISVRRPSGLVRIVAHFGTLLPPINGLDGHINVANPGFLEHRSDAAQQVLLLPPFQRFGGFSLKGSTHGVLA